jgi:hypothetical protein
LGVLLLFFVFCSLHVVLCLLVTVWLFFVFWSLYCSSLSFGRCIVALCLLVAKLLFFVFWSL